MPNTIREWQHLAEIYAKGLEIEKREKSLMRIELNKLKQKIDRNNIATLESENKELLKLVTAWVGTANNLQNRIEELEVVR